MKNFFLDKILREPANKDNSSELVLNDYKKKQTFKLFMTALVLISSLYCSYFLMIQLEWSSEHFYFFYVFLFSFLVLFGFFIAMCKYRNNKALQCAGKWI